MASLPLENIKLVEVSTSEPAAFCACHLGDLGAEILRIELPGKVPDYPQQVWDMANRNKKSIFLNPESDEERKIFEKMVRWADIFVEDQPVGSLSELGMGYDTLKEINPGLIYCSLSSYGQGGPYSEVPGDEICAQALGGMLMLRDNTLGNIGNPHEGQPEIPDVMVAETKAALHAAVGILAALMARRKTARGQYIDVCLFDGVVSQRAVRPMFNLKQEVTGFQIYQTQDRKYIVTAAIEPWTWKNLVEKVGRNDLGGITQASEQERRGAISILQDIFKAKTRKEWLDIFQDVDTELSPAYSFEEALSDPHIRSREMLIEVEGSDGKKTLQYSIPMKFSENPGRVRYPAPKIGQDTEKVFSEFRPKERKR